ncbi:MAG: hypothetical protein ACFFDH_09495 [Promethearchaeota archaeon]
MKCDKCHLDVGEILVLRKDNFTKQGKAKYFRANGKGKVKCTLERVCWYCFKQLTRFGDYIIGEYWASIIYDISRRI